LQIWSPHYPKAGNGRRPYPLEVMLRIRFMQQWFNLSDPAMEEALYDSTSIRLCQALAHARQHSRRDDDSELSPSAGKARLLSVAQ